MGVLNADHTGDRWTWRIAFSECGAIGEAGERFEPNLHPRGGGAEKHGPMVGLITGDATADGWAKAVAFSTAKSIDKIYNTIALDSFVGVLVPTDDHIGSPLRKRPLTIGITAVLAARGIG